MIQRIRYSQYVTCAVTLLTLGTISSFTRISVWLSEVLVEDEFVVASADAVLHITKTRAANNIFVNSISEEAKDKEILICHTVG